MIVVIGELSLHTFNLVVNIILQCLDGYMPVIGDGPVGIDLGIIIRTASKATNLQRMLIEEPRNTVDIICNLFYYPAILAFCLILLLFYMLIQLIVFSDMAESAWNVISIPVTIYPVYIFFFPDFIREKPPNKWKKCN